MGLQPFGRLARSSLIASLWAVSAAHAQSWTAVPLGNQGGSLRITGPFNGPNPNPDSKNRYHTGIDIVNSDGKVRSVAKGVVSKVQGNDGCQCGAPHAECEDKGLGNSIIIEHDAPRGGKVYSLYAHLRDKPTLRKDDPVGLGEQIGVMGQTAFGCANVDLHLHWETKTKSVLENPTGTPTTFGYGPAPSEQRGYYVPIFADVFKDIRNAVGTDRRFSRQADSLAYTLPEWSSDWALATVPYHYVGACSCLNTYVWVYHITLLVNENVRYTIWFDPETNSWRPWTRT